MLGQAGDGWKLRSADSADGQFQFVAAEPCGGSEVNVCSSDSQLHSEVEKPLLTFRGDNFKKDLKKYDHHIADLRKQLASRYAGVEKVSVTAGGRRLSASLITSSLSAGSPTRGTSSGAASHLLKSVSE